MGLEFGFRTGVVDLLDWDEALIRGFGAQEDLIKYTCAKKRPFSLIGVLNAQIEKFWNPESYFFLLSKN